MNYENNNPGNMPGNVPDPNSGMNNVPNNGMNYNQNPMNGMDTMNQMSDQMGSMNQMTYGNGNMMSSKPKKNFIPIIIAVVAIVAIIGGFTAYKVFMSSPKMVFQSAIKSFYNGVSNTLTEVDNISENFDMENKALTMSLDAKFDTNIESSEDLGFKLGDMTLGGGIGLDANNKEATFNGFIKGSNEEVKINAYYTDEKAYVTGNFIDDLIYAEGEDVDIDFEEINEYINKLKEQMPEVKEVDYVVEKITSALSKSLDKEYMDKESTKMDVSDDEESNFTKYSYIITDKALRSLVKDVVEELINDDEFIRIIAEIGDVEKDEVKEGLEDLRDSTEEIEYEEKVVLNIYTRGFLNTLSGISIEFENEEVISYVDDGKNFRITMLSGDESLVVDGAKDGKETVITFKEADKDILNVTIKELSEEKIDVSFELHNEENTFGGSFYLTCKEEKTKISGEYGIKVQYNEEYIEISGNYEFTSKDKLDIPDTKNAVNINDVDMDAIVENLEEIVSKDKVLDAMMSESIDEYYQAQLNLNTIGMKNLISVDEIKEVVGKNQPAVIFVGDSYYSTYSEAEAAEVLENIQEAQDEYNFYSYQVADYNYQYDENIKNYFSTVVPTCIPTADTTTPTCAGNPTIYFVKDGQIVSALQGAISIEAIKEQLQVIGIATN